MNAGDFFAMATYPSVAAGPSAHKLPLALRASARTNTSRHSGAGRNPGFRSTNWIPAYAGMTECLRGVHALALWESTALTKALRNLVAALFSLEKSRAPDNIGRVIASLVDWLKEPEQAGLHRAFVVWIKRVLLPGRMPGIDLSELSDLLEIKTMLAETVIEWTQQWKQQGLEQGLLEGELKGEANVLERQLTKRFGPLSDDTRTRLKNATAEQLELWADRILDAPTLAAIFGNH